MPSAEEILSNLASAANEAVALAILWHVVVAVALLALILGWRPSKRLAGSLLALPIASSAAVAFSFGNPFNGTILGGLAIALVGLAFRWRSGGVVRGSSWESFAGVLMIAYGLFYPHFLVTPSPLRYLYAAPTGLVPCPTLALVIGFALLAGGLKARAWCITLAAAGLFYGLVGIWRLRVVIDVPLLLGSAALLIVMSPIRRVRSGSASTTAVHDSAQRRA